MATKTYFEAHKRASSFLQVHHKDHQALLIVFLEQLKWSKTDWLLNMNEEIPLELEKLLQEDMKLLMKDMPPQYILGYTDFYNLRLHVTEATLIPRPETEELVELVLAKTSSEEMTVADIGTGSGAIAISLKKERPNWRMLATDISQPALQVARANAVNLGCDVEFFHTNLLEDIYEPVEVIISNPPYIAESEKEVMDASVLKYEPQTALFAKHNGLYFYEEIAKMAKKKLTPKGKIFLEIGYQQKEAVEEIFKQAFPEKKVQTYQDLAGLDRMVVVENAI